MKRLICSFSAVAALLLAACTTAPAAAQTASAVTVSACGTPNNTPKVGNPYPITQDTTGVLCTSSSGGGGGSASFTAAAGGTLPVVAGTNKPGVIDLFSHLGVILADPTTGTALDPNAALPTGTNVIGSVGIDQASPGTSNAVDLKYIATGVTTLAGIGNTGTGALRVFPAFAGATQVTFSTSTAETIEVIPLSGSTVTYVLFDKVVVDGTVGFTWKYGTGSNCGTGTTTLDGPYNLTAQNGWVEGNGAAPVLIVPAGKALCRTTSAGTTVTSGRLLYVQF